MGVIEGGDCRRMEHTVEVGFWGTRGSGSTPYKNRLGYGGNTSCLSIRWDEGIVVLDAGSGIEALGTYLEQNKVQMPIHILLTHMHLDHIIGLPMFQYLFKTDAQIHLYGEARCGMSFQESLNRVLGPPYWPIRLSECQARLFWHELHSGESYALEPDISFNTIKSNHPDTCSMYRLEVMGKSIVYGLDCEPEGDFWDIYKAFAMNTDLLVFDATYTDEEYPGVEGFGHGTWQQGVRMAKACKAGQVYLCHHHWSRTDRELESLNNQVHKLASNVQFAKEGQLLYLR